MTRRALKQAVDATLVFLCTGHEDFPLLHNLGHYQQLKEVIRSLNTQPASRVVFLWAGSGYFTIRLEDFEFLTRKHFLPFGHGCHE